MPVMYQYECWETHGNMIGTNYLIRKFPKHVTFGCIPKYEYIGSQLQIRVEVFSDSDGSEMGTFIFNPDDTMSDLFTALHRGCFVPDSVKIGVKSPMRACSECMTVAAKKVSWFLPYSFVSYRPRGPMVSRRM